MIRLVAFLGNPGTQYARTRHNVAWVVAQAVADALAGGGDGGHHGVAPLSWRRKFKGELAEITTSGARCRLLKPLTMMNRSGAGIQAAAAFFHIGPDEILVVHDEIELPFGDIALKSGGGVAGHNGLRSTASALGSRDFRRLRIGVGRPASGSVSSYVLSAFSEEEQSGLSTIARSAADWIVSSIQSGSFREQRRSVL